MEGLNFFRHKVSKLFFAAVLSLALLFPYAAESVPTLDHHHHICYDATPHFHKTTLDCTLCHFHFPIYNFEVFLQEKVTLPEKEYKVYVGNDFELSFFNHLFFLRRGPPIFS